MDENYSNLTLQFRMRLETARQAVADARAGTDKVRLAKALMQLGSIERRPPFMAEVAISTFIEAAELCRELGMPLDEAWCIRHVGIIREYQDRLDDAERSYDEALALYRKHAEENSLDYANTVRYPSVVKNRLGKRAESMQLWEEAHDRYKQIGPAGLCEGVAEAAAWLTIFAIEKGDRELAQEWFARASEASTASSDPDTHKFIADVKARLEGP
jgi:tetratricopeptide (TPR) repeat protein